MNKFIKAWQVISFACDALCAIYLVGEIASRAKKCFGKTEVINNTIEDKSTSEMTEWNMRFDDILNGIIAILDMLTAVAKGTKKLSGIVKKKKKIKVKL